MKVWKDADEVIRMVHDIEDKQLREADKEMQEIPKFNKNKRRKTSKKVELYT